MLVENPIDQLAVSVLLIIFHVHALLISGTPLTGNGITEAVAERDTAIYSETNWCYQETECKQGAAGSGWEEETCKNGVAQSPINIDPQITRPRDPFYILKPTYQFQYFTLAVKDGKLTLTPEWSPDVERDLRFRHGYNTYFILDHVEFHWGPYDDIGSEHTIDGKSASMEMQLVYHMNKFTSYKEALRSREKAAIAIVGVLLVADPSMTGESDLWPIVSNLAKLANSSDQKVDVYDKTFMLTNFLPEGSPVFSYHGSMTIPPCQENVLWYIFRTPAFIKPSDVEAFRNVVEDEDGNLVKMNYRKQQRHNGAVDLGTVVELWA